MSALGFQMLHRPIKPATLSSNVSPCREETMTDQTDETKILRIDEEGITVPQNDGAAGSALYNVPLDLNRVPTADWAAVFVQTWNRPPTWSSMHRPGIASVEGSKIWLRGTTIEEIEKYHLSTLKLCVEAANEQCKVNIQKKKAAEAAKQSHETEHRQHVKEAIKRLKFD